MISIFNNLFFENYNYNLFVFVLGILILEFFILYRTDYKNKQYIILIISTFFGVSMLFRMSPDMSEGEYSVIAHPHDSGCLIENYKEAYPEEYESTVIRYYHYFEGKKIELFADARSGLGIHDGFDEWFPRLYMEVLDENAAKVSEKDIERVTSNTHHLKKDGRLYLIDKTWKSADTIVCIDVSNQIYFLSKDLYEDIVSGEYEKDLLSEREQKIDNVVYMNRQRGERDVNQMLFLLIVYFLGWTIAFVSTRGKGSILAAFLAFPIGIALLATIGIVYILLGIPLRKSVLLVTLFLSLILAVILIFKNRDIIKSRMIIMTFAVASVLDIFVVSLKIFRILPDSVSKMMWGVQIAEYGLTRQDALQAKAFGLMEPIIHAIGWKFHIDHLYGMYPLMSLCAVGIFISALYYFDKKHTSFKGILCILSCLFLVTNNDYLFVGLSSLANGAVGAFFISLLVLLLLKIKENLPVEIPLILVVMSIAITRVEGTCYLCLFFALICGLKTYTKKYWYVNVIASVTILIWQVGLFIYGTDDKIFWNKSQGYMLVTGALIVAVIPLILRLDCKFFAWVQKKYFWITTILFLLISVVIYFVDPYDLSKNALRVMMRHTATSLGSNSAAICCFILLMIPLIFSNKKKDTGFLVALCVEYILMTYLIFCFRNGYPIHVKMADSCRRIIQQLMPIVMFALCYIVVTNEKEMDGKCLKNI